jgi:hypothetical protein
MGVFSDEEDSVGKMIRYALVKRMLLTVLKCCIILLQGVGFTRIFPVELGRV